MKKAISVIVSIAIVMCVFASAMPSFAVDYGKFSCEIVNDEIVITKYIGTGATNVTVPKTLNGLPVVAIGEGAFMGNNEITTVKVNEGVRDIGASAFENCTSLATITLPTTITHIGEKAIYNTAYYNTESNWKKPITTGSSGGIDFGNSIPQIPWEDIIAQKLTYLYLGTNLIEISFSGTYSLKSGTRVIADGAFAGCEAQQVELSSSLVTIGNNAFKDCKKLKQVIFEDALEVIGDSAFEGCTSLEKINLPDKYIEVNSNAFYNTGFYNNSANWENNALYINSTLIDTQDNDDVVRIKEGTKYIIGKSLGKNDIIIPETVVGISDNAFVDGADSTIFGYAETYAQEYATENNIRFVDMGNLLKGDLNLDGKLDVDDYKILCEIATTQRKPDFIEKIVGDMDDDGAVDGIDVIVLDLMLNDMPPSRLKGDVNGDGKVDSADYDLLVKIVSTSERITDNVMFQRADINEDGAVDSFDAVHLELALNGIVPLV